MTDDRRPDLSARSPSLALLLDTLARLHCAAEAMGIQPAAIRLDQFTPEDQARWSCRAADDFRSWVNGEEPKPVPLEDPNPIHQALTGRAHHSVKLRIIQ